MDISDWMAEEQQDLLCHVRDWMRSPAYREDIEMMAGLRYRNEKDQIISQLWEIVNRNVEIDDVGCDWFTVGHFTYIANLGWRVSEDEEVAKLVAAINCLNGYPDLIYRRFDDVPEHMRAQESLEEF